MNTLLMLLFAVVPFVLLAALLLLSQAVQARRAVEIARQIRLTDAVHARMGAVLAPVVRKPRGRPWQVLVTAPLERPEIVNGLIAVVADEFAAGDRARPEAFQVVLSPREDPVARARRPVAAATWRGPVTARGGGRSARGELSAVR